MRASAAEVRARMRRAMVVARRAGHGAGYRGQVGADRLRPAALATSGAARLLRVCGRAAQLRARAGRGAAHRSGLAAPRRSGRHARRAV
jgi:hypothetical protein